MKKQQLLSTIALSTITLAQAGFVSAAEIAPVDPTVPTTEIVTPADPAAPVETPTEPTQPIETPTEPTNPLAPIEPETPAPPVDPTLPSMPNPAVPDVEDTGGVNIDHTNPTTPTAPSTDNSSNNQAPAPNINDAGGVTIDHTQADKGKSQTGTTSTVTGQVIHSATLEAPIQTNTGVSIVDTHNGQVVLSDGSTATPEAIGAITNVDKTITVTKADGTKVTLPHTGEATSLLSILGAGLLGVVGILSKKKHI